MSVFVEEIERTGFSGLLAEAEEASNAERSAPTARATEGPGTCVPVATFHSASDPARSSAVAAFCAWLDDERERLAS